MTLEELRAALDARLVPEARRWLAESLAAVRRDPPQIRLRFPAAGRHLGRGAVVNHASSDEQVPRWTMDQAGRVLLLAELGDRVVDELDELYRYGDADEQRAIVAGLHLLPIGGRGLPLVVEALRSNDARLVAATVGPYGSARLPDHLFRHAVLKCVFVGVPLAAVHGLDRRADSELARMLAGYALERVAAGRDVPADVWAVVHRFDPWEELAAIEAEMKAPRAAPRAAARRALAALAAERRRS
ncbi:MAG: EboA domain-containing protein [Actinomycetota bacterium]|nr:EboA domain-containing protein [Actinomycetota bacterium]